MKKISLSLSVLCLSMSMSANAKFDPISSSEGDLVSRHTVLLRGEQANLVVGCETNKKGNSINDFMYLSFRNAPTRQWQRTELKANVRMTSEFQQEVELNSFNGRHYQQQLISPSPIIYDQLKTSNVGLIEIFSDRKKVMTAMFRPQQTGTKAISDLEKACNKKYGS